MVCNGPYVEYNGIVGRSVFFDALGFDVIRDMYPEPMHLMDGGFFKALMAKMFRVSNVQPHKAGYKRTSIVELAEKWM